MMVAHLPARRSTQPFSGRCHHQASLTHRSSSTPQGSHPLLLLLLPVPARLALRWSPGRMLAACSLRPLPLQALHHHHHLNMIPTHTTHLWCCWLWAPEGAQPLPHGFFQEGIGQRHCIRRGSVLSASSSAAAAASPQQPQHSCRCCCHSAVLISQHPVQQAGSGVLLQGSAAAAASQGARALLAHIQLLQPLLCKRPHADHTPLQVQACTPTRSSVPGSCWLRRGQGQLGSCWLRSCSGCRLQAARQTAAAGAASGASLGSIRDRDGDGHSTWRQVQTGAPLLSRERTYRQPITPNPASSTTLTFGTPGCTPLLHTTPRDPSHSGPLPPRTPPPPRTHL